MTTFDNNRVELLHLGRAWDRKQNFIVGVAIVFV